MHALLRSALSNLLPPVVPKAWHRMRGWAGAGPETIGFTGHYASWEDASRDAEGYDAPFILERVRASTAQVRDGHAAYERDGVTFQTMDYPFPLLACLLRAASACGNRLRVLDFGGALGSTYFQCRDFLTGLIRLRWDIVEQRHFVECGLREFQTETLRFFPDVAACLAEGPVDVVLLSSVLPYLPRPHEELAALLTPRPRYVLLDRTPFLDADGDRLTLQHVPAYVYGKPVRYPAWFFGRKHLPAALSRAYRLLAAFDALDSPARLPPADIARYVGQFWELSS
jgi:putative methyltransferase (TIGR04325 family)